jgi:hypothetical protein
VGAPRSRVRISDHAWQRARERMPRAKLNAHKVRQHLDGALRAGVAVNEQGAIHVPIGGGREAICVPEPWGGWMVLTVINTNGEGSHSA